MEKNDFDQKNSICEALKNMYDGESGTEPLTEEKPPFHRFAEMCSCTSLRRCGGDGFTVIGRCGEAEIQRILYKGRR